MPGNTDSKTNYNNLEDLEEDTDAKNNPSVREEEAERNHCNRNTACSVIIVTASALGSILYWNSSEKAAVKWQQKLSIPAWTRYLPKFGGLSTNFFFILSALFTLTGLAKEPFNWYAFGLAVISNISTYWIANSDALWAKNWEVTTTNGLGTIINTAVNYVSNYYLLVGLNKKSLSSEQKTQIKDLEKEQFKIRNNGQALVTSSSKKDRCNLPWRLNCLSLITICLGISLKWLLSIVPLYWQNIGYTVSTFNAVYTWQPNSGGIISASILALIYLISVLGFTIKGHHFLNHFINKIKTNGIPIALKQADSSLQIVFVSISLLALFSGFGADDANFSCWEFWLNTSSTAPAPTPTNANHTFINNSQTLNTHQTDTSNPPTWIWLSGIMGNIGALCYNFFEILSFMIEKLEECYDKKLSFEDQQALKQLKQQIENINTTPTEEDLQSNEIDSEETSDNRRFCFSKFN
jgi:hypothetical protein